MSGTTVDATDDAAGLRVGLASTAGGFWFVSLAPVIVASSAVHGLTMAFWRSWIGAAVLGAVLLARRGFSVALLRASAPAGLCFGLSIGMFFWASQLTSIANASLITILQPIPLAVLAFFFFGESLTRIDYAFASVALAGAGVLIVAGDSSGTGDIRGDLLALASILLGAGYFAFAKQVLVSQSVVSFMVGMFVWAGVALTPVVLVSGEAVLAPSSEDWLKVLAVAFLPGIGHVLINFAHGKAPLNVMGLFQLLIPVNATLMALWFLDQSVSALQVVGMVVVIVALGMQALARSRAAA